MTATVPTTTERASVVVGRWHDTADEVPLQHWYVETFWLPILGPTAFLTARLLDRALTDSGDLPFQVTTSLLGYRLGVAPAVTRKALTRLALWGFAREDDALYEVRSTVRMLHPKQIRRLDPSLVALHAERYPGGTS